MSIVQDGSTALIQAAWYGRADCVRLLMDAGVDKEAKSKVCIFDTELICLCLRG